MPLNNIGSCLFQSYFHSLALSVSVVNIHFISGHRPPLNVMSHARHYRRHLVIHHYETSYVLSDFIVAPAEIKATQVPPVFGSVVRFVLSREFV